MNEAPNHALQRTGANVPFGRPWAFCKGFKETCLTGVTIFMKTLVIAALLSITSSAFADIGTPASTVESVIRHAQDGSIVAVDMEAIAKVPKHALTKDSLLYLLKGIDPYKQVFQVKDKEKNVFWFPDKGNPNMSLVRLLEPRRLDFEVLYVHDETIGCKGYYKVISIHP
jgi:hypothetical protein